jgi:hypothetical protein
MASGPKMDTTMYGTRFCKGKSFEKFGSVNKGLDQSQRYLKVK